MNNKIENKEWDEDQSYAKIKAGISVQFENHSGYDLKLADSHLYRGAWSDGLSPREIILNKQSHFFRCQSNRFLVGSSGYVIYESQEEKKLKIKMSFNYPLIGSFSSSCEILEKEEQVSYYFEGINSNTGSKQDIEQVRFSIYIKN